ncbi:MAG TPA: hypothetical protein VMD59_21450 [Acidimicrobiales bacterium]|nr:hypothetical protein [Acidimicrobiales bacterium]
MDNLPPRTQRRGRADAHNASVDVVLVALGRCGMTHLATGRVCAEPGRHQGPCEFTRRSEAYGALTATVETPTPERERVAALVGAPTSGHSSTSEKRVPWLSAHDDMVP